MSFYSDAGHIESIALYVSYQEIGNKQLKKKIISLFIVTMLFFR